jgi:hypothetical protein
MLTMEPWPIFQLSNSVLINKTQFIKSLVAVVKIIAQWFSVSIDP